MPTTLSLIDRLRIERAVWTLDTYVSGLPGRSRRAIRRELRTNLRSSAAAVGVRQALFGLGSLRRLGLSYLDAEYGEGRPRPQLLKGMAWGIAVEFAVMLAMIVGFDAYLEGLEAGNPGPGTYVWDRIEFLGMRAEVTYDAAGFSGFAWSISAIFLVYTFTAFVLGSRLWRAVPIWWQRVRRDRAERRSPAAAP
jgi:hypothetical protein